MPLLLRRKIEQERTAKRNGSVSRATTNGSSIGSGISRDANLVTASAIDGDAAAATTLSPMGDVGLAAIVRCGSCHFLA
jgi:hypothetical protein